MKVLDNPGFQSKPSETDPVPGWAVSKRLGVSIITDTTQGHVADLAGRVSKTRNRPGSPATGRSPAW